MSFKVISFFMQIHLYHAVLCMSAGFSLFNKLSKSKVYSKIVHDRENKNYPI